MANKYDRDGRIRIKEHKDGSWTKYIYHRGGVEKMHHRASEGMGCVRFLAIATTLIYAAYWYDYLSAGYTGAIVYLLLTPIAYKISYAILLAMNHFNR